MQNTKSFKNEKFDPNVYKLWALPANAAHPLFPVLAPPQSNSLESTATCDYASSNTPILSRHMKKRTAGETANRCDLSTPVNHKLAFGSPSGQPLPSDEHHQMTLETDSSQKSRVVAQKCGDGVTREKFRQTGSSSRSR